MSEDFPGIQWIRNCWNCSERWLELQFLRSGLIQRWKNTLILQLTVVEIADFGDWDFHSWIQGKFLPEKASRRVVVWVSLIRTLFMSFVLWTLLNVWTGVRKKVVWVPLIQALFKSFVFWTLLSVWKSVRKRGSLSAPYPWILYPSCSLLSSECVDHLARQIGFNEC